MVGHVGLVQLRKVIFFLILMLVSVFLLAALLIVAFLTTSTAGSDWTGNMLNCMGDWMSGTLATSNPYAALFGVSLIILVSLVIVGIGGVVYFQFFPELPTSNRNIQPQRFQSPKNSSPLESVLKTLNEEERKVKQVQNSQNPRTLCRTRHSNPRKNRQHQ